MTILTYRLILKLYGEWATAASKKHGVPLSLILAVIRQESGGNPLAESWTKDGHFRDDGKDGCFGLMQVDPRWALADYNKAAGTPVEKEMLLRPDIAIEVGTWYLAWLIKQFANVRDALRAYNVGIGTVRSGKQLNGSDGSGYAESVLSHEKQFIKAITPA